MTNQHTPGPWWVREHDPLTQGTRGDITINSRNLGDANGAENRICKIQYLPNRADANLIAAAPDMLEALEYNMNFAIARVGDFETAKQMAKAAIAKARGQE